MKIRLQKFLADAGVASRRKSEELIKSGKIKVNGEPVREMGIKVDPEDDAIFFRGKKVEIPQKKIYIALYKPEGYLSSCRRFKEKTVLDLIPEKKRLYPAGRLDKNSSGLIILTNDGDLAEKITHPRYEKEKEYEVLVDQSISQEDLEKMERGIKIGGKKTAPAEAEKISSKKFKIILKEGRKRQIRRMVDALGYNVLKLKRTRIKNIRLNNLKPGEWRYLSPSEINKLKQ